MRAITVAVTLLALLGPTVVMAQEAPKDSGLQPMGLSLTADRPQVALAGSGLLESREMAKAGRWYYEFDLGGTVFTDRSRFKYGHEMNNTGVTVRPLSSVDLDGPGGGGTGTLGYWLTDAIGLELSTSGTLQRQDGRVNCAKDAASGPPQDLGIFPLIDGTATAVFSCGAFGSNIQMTARLSYERILIDNHLDARIRLWEGAKRQVSLEAVAGLAFLYVNQDFSHEVCCSAGPFGTTILNTDVSVNDYLPGVRLGVRGHANLGGKWKLLAGVLGDFYYRASHLDASQRGTVALFPPGPPLPTSVSLHRTDSDSGFVPRLGTSLGLTYDMTDSLTLGVFYRFNGFWNMTIPRFGSPNCSVGGTCAPTDTVRLSADGGFYTHTAGIALTGRF